MTDNNGWFGKPGVPMNPEEPRYHWVKRKGCEPECFFWSAFYRGWRDDGSIIDAPQSADIFHYLGPCLTPAEVDARLADALKWRDAIDGLRTLKWNDPVRDHETPLRAVQRLLNSELTAMALDPAIHKAVQDAIAIASKDALEEAAQEMDCACPQRGAVLAKLAKDGPLSHHWPCEKSDDCCALRGAAIRALAKGEGDD